MTAKEDLECKHCEARPYRGEAHEFNCPLVGDNRPGWTPRARGANDRQVGGEHYKAAFQHWDFVIEAKLSYLEGCATKYLARWRKKNGVQDLEKALHYVDKMLESVTPEQLNMNATTHRGRVTARFCEEGGVDPRDTLALSLICTWAERSHLLLARQAIEQMLADAIVAATPAPEGTQAGCCGGAHEEPEQTYVRSLEVLQSRIENSQISPLLVNRISIDGMEALSAPEHCVIRSKNYEAGKRGWCLERTGELVRFEFNPAE